MPSPGMRGWYVELDEKLVEAFEKLFPDHGAKTRLTADAVIEAVGNKLGWHKSSFPQEGTNVSRNAGRTESPNSGAEGDHADREGTSE